MQEHKSGHCGASHMSPASATGGGGVKRLKKWSGARCPPHCTHLGSPAALGAWCLEELRGFLSWEAGCPPAPPGLSPQAGHWTGRETQSCDVGVQGA